MGDRKKYTKASKKTMDKISQVRSTHTPATKATLTDDIWSLEVLVGSWEPKAMGVAA
jgi:hypothetical protein